MPLPAIDGNRPGSRNSAQRSKSHVPPLGPGGTAAGALGAARRDLRGGALSKSDSEIQLPRRLSTASSSSPDPLRQVRSSLAVHGATPSPQPGRSDLPPLATPPPQKLPGMVPTVAAWGTAAEARSASGIYDADHMQQRVLADLDTELQAETHNVTGLLREERQVQKAQFIARRQLEKQLKHAQMQQQLEDNVRVWLVNYFADKRWPLVSEEIAEREALGRRILTLLQRSTHGGMLDQFQRSCQATGVLKLEYDERQGRRELEEQQWQEVRLKVRVWRDKLDDLLRNQALMSGLDRELRSEFAEIRTAYTRCPDNVRVVRGLKDQQLRETWARELMETMEADQRHSVYRAFHIGWQAVHDRLTSAALAKSRERYCEAEATARACWAQEELQARELLHAALPPVGAGTSWAGADVASPSEALEREEAVREALEVDENERYLSFVEEAASVLRERAEGAQPYAVLLEEWLWVEPQERALLEDDEEAERGELRGRLTGPVAAVDRSRAGASAELVPEAGDGHCVAEEECAPAPAHAPAPAPAPAPPSAPPSAPTDSSAPAIAVAGALPAGRDACSGTAPQTTRPTWTPVGPVGDPGPLDAVGDMLHLGLLGAVVDADGLSMLAEAGSSMSLSRAITVASDRCTLPSRGGTPLPLPAALYGRSRGGTPADGVSVRSAGGAGAGHAQGHAGAEAVSRRIQRAEAALAGGGEGGVPTEVTLWSS